jgi:hypothetical protein
MSADQLTIQEPATECPKCYSGVKKIFERWRTIQDFGTATAPARIEIQSIMWQCTYCGYRFQQYPSGVLPNIRYSQRVIETVQRWVRSGWKSRRISGELNYFGIQIAPRTVRKYKQQYLSRPLLELIDQPPIPKKRGFYSPVGFILALDETKKRGPFWRWGAGPKKKLVRRFILVARNEWTKQIIALKICKRDSSENWMRFFHSIERRFGRPDAVIIDHGLKLIHSVRTIWPGIRIHFDPFHVVHIARLKLIQWALSQWKQKSVHISPLDKKRFSRELGLATRSRISIRQRIRIEHFVHDYPWLRRPLIQLRSLYSHYHLKHGPRCRCIFSALKIRAAAFKHSYNYRWYNPIPRVAFTNGERGIQYLNSIIEFA